MATYADFVSGTPLTENLNYATSYQKALEQAYPYALYFGKLYSTPNNGRFRWVNSKTIEIPSIATTGRVDADRDSIGVASRNYSNSWETKTLVNERKWSTLVHPKDIDQTNVVTSISNITKVFNEEHKFPEMDAYTISKIFSAWSTSIAGDAAHGAYTGKAADTTALTTSTILGVFDNMMLAMDNARVPVTGRVLYVTHEIKTMLKNAQGLQRNWDVQSTADSINRAVNRLDEVEIIGVPRELMKTVYNFTNGWAVDRTAAQINMMLILPSAVITPVSYSFSNLQAPSALTEGKYYYYEESFEDVFILNNKADAIQFNVDYTPASFTGYTVAAGTSGKTKVTLTSSAFATDEEVYFKSAAAAVTGLKVGDEFTTTGYTQATTSGAEVNATAGDKVSLVKVQKATVSGATKYYVIGFDTADAVIGA